MRLHAFKKVDDPAAEGGSAPKGGAPAGTEDLPDWLTKAPEDVRRAITSNTELFDDVKKGYLREKDYTQKTQDLAKQRDKYKGRDLDKEIDELDQWRNWRKQDYPQIEANLRELEQLRTRTAKEPERREEPERSSGGRKKWTTADLLEQERLDEMLSDLETRPFERAREWWNKEELPRLDKYANNLTDTLVGLIKVNWSKDLPPMEQVLREAAASGNRDFVKLVQQIIEGKDTVKKEGFEEGYQRGLKEAEAKTSARTSPPPPGAGAPSWRPRIAAGKQTKGERFADVMGTVEKKYGPLPV